MLDGIAARTAGLAIVVLAALVLGCAVSQPGAQIAQAEQAVNQAEQEGAGQYAPLPLRKAEDKLAAARETVAEEDDDDYVEARRQAEQATVDAELAAAAARRARTEEVVDELSQSVETLEQEVVR
jgi:hypothetical protein